MSLHCVKRSSTNFFCNRKSNNSYSRRCMYVQFTTGHFWFCILYGNQRTSLQSTALLTFLTQCLTEKANIREIYVRLNMAIWTISDTRVATPLSWLQVLLSRFDTKRRCWELRTESTQLRDLVLYVCWLRSRKPPLQFDSQLLEMEFSSKASWYISQEWLTGGTSVRPVIYREYVLTVRNEP